MGAPRILVVEDEQIVAASLRKRLTSLGYDVIALVASGEEAVKKTKELHPDLVLMDIRLEGQMDGIAAATLVRRLQIPVVFLTAYSNEDVLHQAKVTEPYGYILKPFEDRELHVVIEIALYKRQMERWVADQEEQFRQAQKMEAIGRLAGGVAHDFNNLLTIINGYSELLLGTLPDHSKSRQMAAEIFQAGKRAAALTQQLLAFSRKQILQPKVLDLNEVVRNMEAMLRRLIGEDVELVVFPAPQPCQVKADPNQLEQVVMNLAGNARDAMPRGGKVTIGTKHVQLGESDVEMYPEVRPGLYVLLAVTDTGVGMDKATLGRIFEPFFTTKALGKGTGLGLASVFGVVKQSGGHIRVASEPGQGTTFEVYLPSFEAEDKQTGQQAATTIPGGTETVLLAEDEESVRTLARFVLQSAGYKVLAASNGEEALQLCAAHEGPIDLLVTDVVMPKMDGRQLSQAMQALYPHVRVLFLSGYTDDATLRHGISGSEAAFLQKPFSISAFATEVRTLLDKA